MQVLQQKKLRGYSCANGGGASTDSVGRRTLEETNLVVGHSNTKTTQTQGWLGVAIVINSNILSRAERALSLTQLTLVSKGAGDGYCLRKKLDVLDRSTFQKANCMQLGVEMF